MIPPTEQPHPDSGGLGDASPDEVVALMDAVDQRAFDAVRDASGAIARAAGLVADVYGSGGTVAYLATGTSGMLCALDAAELPPTFGVDSARARCAGHHLHDNVAARPERGRHRCGACRRRARLRAG